MIVDTVVYGVLWNKSRYDHGWYTHTQLFEAESMLRVFFGVAGSDGGRRRHVIIETTMFVIGDDQQAVFPTRRIAYGFVNGFDQGLTVSDIVQRMLGLAASIGVIGNIPVVRFDKSVKVGIISLNIGGKSVEAMPIHFVDIMQGGDTRYRPLNRLAFATVYSPGRRYTFCVKRIKDAAILKVEAENRFPFSHLLGGGAVVKTAGRSAVYEKAVRPGRAWQR